jgi:hypothetical protein
MSEKRPAWITAGEAAPGSYFHDDMSLYRSSMPFTDSRSWRITYWWKAVGEGATTPASIADETMVYGPIPRRES